ncbi:MAG: pyridoxal 5'-phosphate synthase glutaminase subunit PdxT [Alphaproteobacteria bacterium]|nr:pyridoxal 5'-phosphate synthase glutaminase subunit PdxT [Alphaproteobacteria bacterium]
MVLKKPIIGVLALQGAVEPHRPHVEAAGGEFRIVKTAEQIREADAYILPGGESTTMLKLIETFGLWDVLAQNFKEKPVWGICAGAILIAETVKNPEQKSFKLLPLTVERNAYGRQLDSHHANIKGYEVSFIRAPIIKDAGPGVEVLAEHQGTPVWLQSGKVMVTTFHPELTMTYPSPMHAAFVDQARQSL